MLRYLVVVLCGAATLYAGVTLRRSVRVLDGVPYHASASQVERDVALVLRGAQRQVVLIERAAAATVRRARRSKWAQRIIPRPLLDPPSARLTGSQW